MSKKPLYQVIFEHYKEKIVSGELNPGDQLPTEMKIAKDFSVSRITATRALKELELSNYIHRIQGSGSYVNEQDWKKEDSNKINKNTPSIISLVLPFNRNKSSADLLSGIENITKKNNYFVTFHNYTNNPIKEKKIINQIVSSGSHGIIFYPSETPQNMNLYSKLIIDNFPVVLIDRTIPGLELSLVSANNKLAFD